MEQKNGQATAFEIAQLIIVFSQLIVDTEQTTAFELAQLIIIFPQLVARLFSYRSVFFY